MLSENGKLQHRMRDIIYIKHKKGKYIFVNEEKILER